MNSFLEKDPPQFKVEDTRSRDLEKNTIDDKIVDISGVINKKAREYLMLWSELPGGQRLKEIESPIQLI